MAGSCVFLKKDESRVQNGKLFGMRPESYVFGWEMSVSCENRKLFADFIFGCQKVKSQTLFEIGRWKVTFGHLAKWSE